MRALGMHRAVSVTPGRPLLVARDIRASWVPRPLVAGRFVYAYEGPRWGLALRGERTVVVNAHNCELGGVPRDAVTEIPMAPNGGRDA